ncbi:MAG: hypothetical protein R2792_01595 [Saprospiraceae bacterium]
MHFSTKAIFPAQSHILRRARFCSIWMIAALIPGLKFFSQKQQLIYPDQQLIFIKRLGKHRICPSLQCLYPISMLGQGSKNNNGIWLVRSSFLRRGK